MKKQFLLLPLVAILAACNKGSGNTDIFTKARGIKVSQATKQGVYDRYDTYSMITRFQIETSEETREKGGEWTSSGDPSSVVTYFQTVCWHTENDNGCYLNEIYNYDTESETSNCLFKIETIEGKLQYTVGGGEDAFFDDTAKGCYKQLLDSVHSWGVSYFAGATYFLAGKTGKSMMPQVALEKFTKNFELVEEGPGSFYISKNGDCLYKITQVQYFIDEYMVIYEDYLLKGYRNRFGLAITYKEGTTEYRSTLIYTFQLVDVKYIFAS